MLPIPEEPVVTPPQSTPRSAPMIDASASEGFIELPNPVAPTDDAPAATPDAAVAPPTDAPAIKNARPTDVAPEDVENVASPSDNAEAMEDVVEPPAPPLPPQAPPQSGDEEAAPIKEASPTKPAKDSTGMTLPQTRSGVSQDGRTPNVKYLFGDDNSQTIEFGPTASFTDSVDVRLDVEIAGSGLIELK
ncbi:MAG: hypothetical protein AAF802_25870 [Planctomycetota bacterium]